MALLGALAGWAGALVGGDAIRGDHLLGEVRDLAISNPLVSRDQQRHPDQAGGVIATSWETSRFLDRRPRIRWNSSPW